MEKEEILKNFVEEQDNALQVKKTPIDSNNQSVLSPGNELGWISLNVEDFPSKGYFYPDDLRVVIKSATAAEIRHWSSLSETDLNQLDEMLNYILERCCRLKSSMGAYNWKDLIEIDRFYIILAIRELTFKSENPVQVNISEDKTRPLVKEMISFAEFGDSIMKYYSDEYKCFELKFKTGKVHYLGMPTIGVTNWLKNYVINKQKKGLGIDEDFISYAPFLINEWRGLTDSVYEELCLSSHDWSISEISVFAKFKEIILSTVNPEIVYTDEHGMEVRVPLNFRGGVKSLFIIPNAFDELL